MLVGPAGDTEFNLEAAEKNMLGHIPKFDMTQNPYEDMSFVEPIHVADLSDKKVIQRSPTNELSYVRDRMLENLESPSQAPYEIFGKKEYMDISRSERVIVSNTKNSTTNT